VITAVATLLLSDVTFIENNLRKMAEDRPELQAPPEIFYDEKEARKYTSNRRIIEVQSALTERALELLNLPEDASPKLLLDLGCGSGLSGEIIDEAGHMWIGLDISEAMLSVALEREMEGDLCLSDLGQGLPLREGVFDGAVSISAVQWLCNADTSESNPWRRINSFFRTLYACLSKDARAVLQIYPKDDQQSEMLSKAAMEAGFTGGLVVDYPNSTKAKKTFLVLMVSGGVLPEAEGGEEDLQKSSVDVSVRQRKQKSKKTFKRREWVLKKKARNRMKGFDVPGDTKFTGRRRRPNF